MDKLPKIDMNAPLDNFQMTSQEAKAISEAMKKPEFMELLSDYMKEISDPKNKEEYDQYLKQMENDKDLPKGTELIKPKASFCVKTLLRSKQNKKHEQKLFINICEMKEIPQASFEPKDDGKGGKGQSCKIPYVINKARYDQDKNQNVCQTIDVAYNPNTIELTRKAEKFKELVVATALDAVEKQMAEKNDIVSKDFKILKRLKCKGDEPSFMTININNLKKQAGETKTVSEEPSETQKRQKGGQDFAPKLYREFMESQKSFQDQKQKAEEKEKKEEKLMEEEENEAKKINVLNRPIEAPKYKVVYTYFTEYEDFLNKREEKNAKRPKHINIEINLPLISSIQDLVLNINERNLVLEVPKIYYLDLPLSYSVLKDGGDAKFEKKAKKLKVTLIVQKIKEPALVQLNAQDQASLKIDPSAILPDNQESENEVKKTQNIYSEDIKDKDNEERNEPLKVQESLVMNKSRQGDLDDIEELKISKTINSPEFDIDLKQEHEEESPNYEGKDGVLEFSHKKSGLKFVDLSKKSHNDMIISSTDGLLSNEKGNALIEEILEEADMVKSVIMQQPAMEYTHCRLEFKTQEDFDRYFFIVNLPGYDKNRVSFLLWDKKIFLRYIDEQKYIISFLLIILNEEIDYAESVCNKVSEYIVINVKKMESKYFEKKFFNKTDITFDEFGYRWSEAEKSQLEVELAKKRPLSSSVIIQEGEIPSSKETGEKKDFNSNQERPNESKADLNNADIANHPPSSNIKEENKEDESAEIQKETIEPVSEKNSLQFLAIPENNMIFQID